MINKTQVFTERIRQWWSILSTQFLQTVQWWVLGGFGEIHFLQMDTTSGTFCNNINIDRHYLLAYNRPILLGKIDLKEYVLGFFLCNWKMELFFSKTPPYDHSKNTTNPLLQPLFLGTKCFSTVNQWRLLRNYDHPTIPLMRPVIKDKTRGFLIYFDLVLRPVIYLPSSKLEYNEPRTLYGNKTALWLG